MSVPVETICAERLESWKQRLIENHSTPALLMGVGHDEHAGELHLVVCEELSLEDLQALTCFLYQKLVVDKCLAVAAEHGDG
ncbi:MAG: hypothetical protein ABSG68_26945 [Thermoguttaceae bacterium]|jgi:hypothetical protein